MVLPITAGSVSFEQRHRQRIGAYGVTAETQAAMLMGQPIETQAYGAETYINTPRALGSAVHQDPPYWLPLHAAILLDNLRVPVSSLFPPLPAERGFISYGGAANLHCTLARAVEAALVECWCMKWTHRARRPEELLADQGSLHTLWHERFAPLLEPWGGRMPFPIVEGSPMHPTWPAGHPVIAGAAATVMKAFRANGPWPVLRAAALLAAAGHDNIPGGIAQASPDGNRLFPAQGNLTVHGEIDRMAWAIGFGRLPLGVHLRDDVMTGLLVGQMAAVKVLRRERDEAAELGLAPWGSTTFAGFFGTTVTI
jgi:membrane-associated phospholipid phosphatase